MADVGRSCPKTRHRWREIGRNRPASGQLRNEATRTQPDLCDLDRICPELGNNMACISRSCTAPIPERPDRALIAPMHPCSCARTGANQVAWHMSPALGGPCRRHPRRGPRGGVAARPRRCGQWGSRRGSRRGTPAGPARRYLRTGQTGAPTTRSVPIPGAGSHWASHTNHNGWIVTSVALKRHTGPALDPLAGRPACCSLDFWMRACRSRRRQDDPGPDSPRRPGPTGPRCLEFPTSK